MTYILLQLDLNKKELYENRHRTMYNGIVFSNPIKAAFYFS